jgi:hypothetical protein
MTQESRAQETPTPAQAPGELPAAPLACVVGGDEGTMRAGDKNGIR